MSNSLVIETAGFNSVGGGGPGGSSGKEYYLTMDVTLNGAGFVSPGANTLQSANSVITINATHSSASYTFNGWTGSCSNGCVGYYTGPSDMASITINGPITETASFTPIYYYLTMSASGPGTVSQSSGDYAFGSSVPITAKPDSGDTFAGWACTGIGCYSGTSASTNITINGPMTETATFGPAYYNDYRGGTCMGSITYDSSAQALTGDVYASGNVTIDQTASLATDGFNFYVGSTFVNHGTITTGYISGTWEGSQTQGKPTSVDSSYGGSGGRGGNGNDCGSLTGGNGGSGYAYISWT